MPGETPDYGRLNAQQTVYPVLDLGELAVRLGSPITHDRRGDVIWWDDYEWTLNKWGVSAPGTGASAALSVARARNGRTSNLLTGASEGSISPTVTHLQAFPVLSLLGSEVSFSLGGSIGSFYMESDVYNGASLSSFVLRWDDTVDALYYKDAAGAYVELLDTGQLIPHATLFHTLKLVVDPVAGEYVRAILNEAEVDMAGVAGRVSADATAPSWLIAHALASRAGNNDTVYLDDAILTQNEPL